MKIAAIFIGLLVTFATAEGGDPPLHLAIARAYSECEESMNLTEDPWELLAKGVGKDNRDVQCYQACMMEKAGLRNGLSIDLKKIESLLRSDESQCKMTIRFFMEIFTACKAEAEVSDDECEVMGNFWYCYNKKIDEEYC